MPASHHDTQNVEPSAPDSLRLVVAIATRGRPGVLQETLADLALQQRLPDAILVGYLEPSDIGDAPALFPAVQFLQAAPGAGGSCAQRNNLLAHAGDRFDLIFFMDDDFYLHRAYLLRLEQAFAADSHVLGATGKVLADGAKGPGLAGAAARAQLAAIAHAPTLAEAPVVPAFNTYGCNMGFRVEALRAHDIRFDEHLPAYGWYEDMDFSRRLLPYGALVQVPGAFGVHLGVKSGRTSGKRFGYSQVANCVYLARKGTYPWDHARLSILRNFAANLTHSLRPESYVDRRGRLRGNLLAFWEVLRGTMRPDRILEL